MAWTKLFHENCLRVVSSLLSVNSSDHSGRILNRSYVVLRIALRCLAGLEDVLDESYANDAEEELVLELDENHGNTVRGMFPWCTGLISHFCFAVIFLSTIHTFVHLCFSKSLPNDKTDHVSPRICPIIKSSRTLTSVLPRLLTFSHWTVPSLWSSWILFELDSLLLSMSIDTPQLATNSRSSYFFEEILTQLLLWTLFVKSRVSTILTKICVPLHKVMMKESVMTEHERLTFNLGVPSRSGCICLKQQ